MGQSSTVGGIRVFFTLRCGTGRHFSVVLRGRNCAKKVGHARKLIEALTLVAFTRALRSHKFESASCQVAGLVSHARKLFEALTLVVFISLLKQLVHVPVL